MKLRDHPLMAYRTMGNWPPLWIEKYADNKTLMGKVGVLTHVGLIPSGAKVLSAHRLQRQTLHGSLLFDDLAFGVFVGNLLKKHIYALIEEIGDLDVSILFRVAPLPNSTGSRLRSACGAVANALPSD